MSQTDIDRAFKVLDDFIEERKANSTTHFDQGFNKGLEGARRIFKESLK